MSVDFTQTYGLQLEDLRDRPWPSLRDHILGLLTIESRISRELRPAK